MSGYTIISSIWKIAATRPTRPILKVFSRKCGVSETKEAGMATETSILEVGIEPQTELIIKSEHTIERTTRLLTELSKSADLNKPEEVKTVLANFKWKDSTKKTSASTLKSFYEYLKIPYVMPKYKIVRELPFIPTEEELDLLISSGHPTTATRLQILKETGARIGELDSLEWTHIDTQRKTIYIIGKKGSNSRILPLSEKAINMINHVKRADNHVFKTKSKGFRKSFEGLRNRLAKKVNNPRLSKIHLHTFRHWKGTTEYHKTRDIYHVRCVLGHRNINNTLLYITLENALYQTASDEWTSIVIHSLEEETQAINTGFELVRAINETTAIYRKRK